MAALAAQSPGLTEFNKNKGKQKYPIIRNILPDDDDDDDLQDKRKLLALKYDETNFPKVLGLITDKYSKNLVKRHCRAIKHLCACYKHGIHLRDVKVALEILKKCHEYIKIDSCYEELAYMLLQLFKEPYFKEKVSDEQTYLEEISSCLTTLGCIAVSSSDNIKSAVASSILTLYTSNPSDKICTPDIKPVSTEFIKTATLQSSVCKSIAECLSQVSDIDSKYILLKTLNRLSDTTVTCDDILDTDVAACLCSSLRNFTKNYNLIFVTVETLWNLLEFGSNEKIQKQLNCENCLRSLRYALIKRISNCSSHADRQLRNDIFVLITLILTKCPSAPFVESGVIRSVGVFAGYPELPTRDPDVLSFELTKQREDFELKKLLFNCIHIICTKADLNDYELQTLSQTKIMLALFYYVRPIKHPFESFWSLAEFEELQLQAMSVLAVLTPCCVEDYIECQGNTRVLSILDWCINSDDFGGHGNSFHGVGGRGSKRAQMRYCIRILRSICSTGNVAVALDLTDQGVITQLIGILSSCSNSSDCNDAIDIELQCDMLFILATLCEGDDHRKELFGENGVKMLLQYLNGYLNVKNGPLNHHRMVLSATDCIWSAVIGCHFNETCFLQNEGAFLLLDLLEACPEKARNITLGALVDLTENKNTIPHLNMWRGKEKITVGKLLVSLWSLEESKLGVKRDENGVITDVTCPIKSVQQEEDQQSLVIPFSFASAAVVDVSDNLRSKIYGMFSRLGFNNVPGLIQADYVTLTVIEKYLDFKVLEVWQEIKDELKTEQIKPVSPDQECMDLIIYSIQEKALEISKVQQSLIKNNLEQEISEELDYYDKIKESHKQEEKTYQDFVNFVDRTSNYTILKEKRLEQLKSIERSRLKSRDIKTLDDSTIVHNTMDSTLNTTTLCGKNVTIKSTTFGDTATRFQLEFQ